MVLDVLDNITYSCNLLSLLIGDLKVESLLELHNELYGVERICTQVACEACLGSNLCLFNAEIINDNLNNFSLNL